MIYNVQTYVNVLVVKMTFTNKHSDKKLKYYSDGDDEQESYL